MDEIADVVVQDHNSFAEKFGVLASRVNHPVVIEYGEGHLRVSPRTVTKPVLRRLLPDRMPDGITFIPR